MNKPIFCIVGQSGAGKSTYLNLLLNDKRLKNKVKELKYCTTRKKRYLEEDSYYFVTDDEFVEEWEADNIVEYRHYEKYDEDVNYFTTYDNLDVPNCEALICAASVDQVINYIEKLNNIYVIDISVDLKERVKRLIDRADNNTEVLEICRRVLEEQEEYSRIDSIDKDILHIYNDNTRFQFSSTGNMLYSLITAANLNTIAEYILDHIK